MSSLLFKTSIFYNFSSILKFYKIFCFDFSQKFLLSNLFLLSKIFKIVFTLNITSGLKNETDIKVINSLLILDLFLNRKSGIVSFVQKYLRKSKNIIFVCQTIFTHYLDVYLFLFLLKKIIKPNLAKRYIFLKYKFLINGFVFYIPDISMLAGLPEDLKKERISIKISCFLNFKSNKKLSTIFLNTLLKYLFI